MPTNGMKTLYHCNHFEKKKKKKEKHRTPNLISVTRSFTPEDDHQFRVTEFRLDPCVVVLYVHELSALLGIRQNTVSPSNLDTQPADL